MAVSESQAGVAPEAVQVLFSPSPSRTCDQPPPLACGLAHLEAGAHDVLVWGAVPAAAVGFECVRLAWAWRKRKLGELIRSFWALKWVSSLHPTKGYQLGMTYCMLKR